MEEYFKNKTVLVTGASTGIGRATALAFARVGAKVNVNCLSYDEDAESLLNVARDENLDIKIFVADVQKSHDIEQMYAAIEQSQRLPDVLINNVGISIVKPMLETSEAEWDAIFNTDVKSVFLCSKIFIPSMLEKKFGVIVNIASELGFSGREKFCAYTAAKGAVITLTRSMAKEFAPEIRVNAVAPGPTVTPMLDKEMAIPDHEESTDDIPLQRFARAEEIAETIVFLASDRAQYYCGDVLSPNGGAVMR